MATLEQVVQQENAWIAACVDVDALIEKIGDWRDSAREAERDGQQIHRMRAGDLIELAQQRVVALLAREMREEKARQAASAPKVAAKQEAGRQSGPAERGAREETAAAAAEKVKAEARLAVAEAAKIELQNELLRAQVEAARRVVPASTAPPSPTAVGRRAAVAGPTQVERLRPTTVGPRVAPPSVGATASVEASRSPRAPAAPREPGPTVATTERGGPPAPVISAEDQLALMSVGRWPPKGLHPGHPFYNRDQDWPADWTLTGLDLGRFRGEIHVTQKVVAAQLGVTTATIAQLESRPREKIGPAMQIALRKAIDVVAEQNRVRRSHAAAERTARLQADSTPQAPVTVVGAVTPPEPLAGPITASARHQEPVAIAAAGTRLFTAPGLPAGFTGADLARLRAERKLSQRRFADALGVGYGMVAKAEVAAEEPLGERMREAVGALLSAGTGRAIE